jgi:hypothetical protein
LVTTGPHDVVIASSITNLVVGGDEEEERKFVIHGPARTQP